MSRQLANLVCAAVLTASAAANAQATFRNLDFESAVLVPIPGDPYGRVQFAPAFPGWTCYVGDVQETSALYNNAFLDSSGMSIMGIGDPFDPPGFREGLFNALLNAGLTFVQGTLTPADESLTQTGLVPAPARSLRFRAYTFGSQFAPFQVTLAGQVLPLTTLESGTDYKIFGADITAWSGQTAALTFIQPATRPHFGNEYLSLDSIEFSTIPIPEPSTCAIFLVGLLFAHRGLRRRK